MRAIRTGAIRVVVAVALIGAMGIYGQFVYVHRGIGVVIVKTSTDPHFAGREHETLAAFRAIGRSVITAERAVCR